MDSSELDRLAEWFKEKWSHGPCPVCGTNDWMTPGDKRLAQIENIDRIGGRIPTLPITCSNCGHILLVNALIAGIRQLPPRQDPIEGEDE